MTDQDQRDDRGGAAGPRRSGGRRRLRVPEAARQSTEAVREAALGLLERRLYSRAELARKLRGRGYDAATVDTVLARLGEVGLVDDRHYAEAFLHDRLRFRPRSRAVLAVELRRRGVEPEDIEQALEALDAELGVHGDLELARALLARRGARLARLDPERRRQRAIDLLRRNGFAWDVIHEALAADTLNEADRPHD
ncbi:MAG: regulatory protein RecX [Candidatus Eiseniibacteriota bacterium]|jgi:regulatory protein